MKKKIFLIIIAAVVLFIWIHSMIPRENSASESTGIMQILQSILDFLHIPITLTDHIVRKLAHFTEYTIEGVILGSYFFPLSLKQEDLHSKIMGFSLPLIIGLFTGFIDETIQIFSGRGPMIEDVWLDFSGVVTGAAIALIITLVRRKHSRKHEGNL